MCDVFPVNGSVVFFLCCGGIESSEKYYHPKAEENSIQIQNLSQWWLLHAMGWIISKEALHCMGEATAG